MKLVPGGLQTATLLERRPRGQLQPGLYVAPSESPAYADVRAAIVAGVIQLAGEHYVEHEDKSLSKVTTALLPQASSIHLPVAANPSIGIGREFFVTALRDYQDWKIRWWREVVQNAVDAKATKVDLAAEQLADGSWVASCTDNGGGMDEDTLLNKFLVLGGTTKEGASGTAGGFGKAKELILLPWLEWWVHSRGVLVHGSGINYTVSRDEEHLPGTRISVRMPADKFTSHSEAIAFVEKCYLPHVDFTVNGKPVLANLVADRLIEEVPGKAGIFFTQKKDWKQNYLLVRTRRLFMFHEWIQEIEGYLLAEITAPSIEILTANRDGFRDWQVRRAISSLANRIAKDTMSALQEKRGLVRKKYKGVGKFQAARRSEADLLEAARSLVPGASGRLKGEFLDRIAERLSLESPLEPKRVDVIDKIHGEVPVSPESPPETVRLSEIERTGSTSRPAEETLHQIGTPDPATSLAILESITWQGVGHVEKAIKQIVWEPDFYVINAVEGFVVPPKFFPERMTPTISRLARVWAELCRYVLIQLGCDLPYGVGWYFHGSNRAAYQGESEDQHEFSSEGEHWLLLNPWKDPKTRKKLLTPTSNEDLSKLYAYAIHEVTHMANGVIYHDESFAAALTYNTALCADGFRYAKRIVRAIPRSKKSK